MKKGWIFQTEYIQKFLIGTVCVFAICFPARHYGGMETAKPEIAKPEKACCSERAKRSSTVEFGTNYTYVTVKQPDSSRFCGSMGGLQGLYEYRPSNFVYAAVKGMWRQGGADAHSATRKLVDVNAHERIGYTFAKWDRSQSLSLFTGVGYRYLAHKLHQNQSTQDFHYNEFYIPIGFLADFWFVDYFSFGLDFMWMPQVNSTVNLVPRGGAQWILEKQIGNVLLELLLNFYLGKDREFTVNLKPFYERWQDGASVARTVLGIPLGVPKNSYNFYGVEITSGYRF